MRLPPASSRSCSARGAQVARNSVADTGKSLKPTRFKKVCTKLGMMMSVLLTMRRTSKCVAVVDVVVVMISVGHDYS